MVLNTPNPMFSIILFIILTIGYFIIKYIFLSKDNSSIYLLIALYSYIGINIISQLIINISLTNEICGASQWYDAFFITSIPWILIFGSLSVLLKIFPGWLMPFSNTFGYAVAKIGSVNELFIDILAKQNKSNDDKLNKALQEIYSDNSLLINQITIDNFDTFWSNSVNGKIFNNDTNKKLELKNFVILKTIISEFIWYILVGLLTVSASYNYIINLACDNSVSSMKARHEEHDRDVELINKSENSGPPRRVYSTYE